MAEKYKIESKVYSYNNNGQNRKTLLIKFVSEFAAGRSFSPVFSTNKTDLHDITEILLKLALKP
jgi:hypothetical protein